MGIPEIKSSSNQSPKWEIPDIWAKNGHCPACGATNLKVIHLPDYADYLFCVHCEISFEVENGCRYIRLKHIPDEYEFADAILHNRWVEASNLSAIISKQRAPAEDKKPSPLPTQTFSEEDAWNRALGMYRMGNKPKMIQLTLMQAGVTQEQAEVVFAKLKKLAEQDAQRQSQKFWAVAGISLLLIVMLMGGWLYMSGNLPVLLGTTTVTPASLADQPSAVDKLLDLVPDDAKPALMNLPDTVVDSSRGPGPASCPATSRNAAKLFGGNSNLWKRDSQYPSWQMINPGDSITVLVPDGMTAGYVDNKAFQFLSVRGPATIYNVNFVVITCD
jgi:hypothetical protein